MKPLRRTLYDITLDRRPMMMAALERRLAQASAPEWPLNFDALTEIGAQEDIDAELAVLVDTIWAEQAPRMAAMGVTRQDALRLIERDGTLAKMRATIEYEYAALFNYSAFGRKTFYFADNLVKRLADTELNVDAATVAPPFRSCLFVFDDETTRQALYAIGKDSAPVPTEEPVNVFINVLPKDDGTRRLALMVWHVDDRRTRLFVKRELLLEDGRRLEDALRTDWSKILPPDDDGHVDETVFYQQGLRFFRIIANAILYLGSTSPDISGELHAEDRLPAEKLGMTRKEKRNRENRKRLGTRLPYVEVGGTIRPLERPAAAGSGKRLDSRFMVRGHWRNQAHGPARALRKLVFIEPHWKGPDMADLVDKPYLVK